ncbi:MAG: DUF2085 domain-containing protein [Chloroflexi bacterium]|nr:DUF2085 domain-containing protein [Chloroflexota bacterium]
MTTETGKSSTGEAGRGGEAHSPTQRLLWGISLLIILGIIIVAPGGLLSKADRVGYAVCHQILDRTYVLGGRPLPLCARCSGQYLAALGGLLWLAATGRIRAGQLPRRSILAMLLAFLAIWGFDGLNSYLTFFPGLPHLYEPSNLLRLATGTLEGMALTALFLPFFNLTVWRRPLAQPTLRGWRDLLGWMLLSTLIVLAIRSEWASLLYPAALLSVLGVLALLTMVNTMIVALALRRDGVAETWGDAAMVLVPGLALALMEILALNLIRGALSRWLGLPF